MQGKEKVLQVIGLSARALPAIEPLLLRDNIGGVWFHSSCRWIQRNLPRPCADFREELWKTVTTDAKSLMAVMLRNPKKVDTHFLGLQQLNMAGCL